MTRIYMPADVAMLARLAETGEVRPVAAVHTVTSWLRGEAPGADVEDLEYTAFADAATASVALLAGSEGALLKGALSKGARRVVISADVPDKLVAERPGGTGADFEGSVKLKRVAAVHVDDADAAAEIAAALASGEVDLELIEANVLDWYAPAEIPDLLAALSAPT
ncbi:DUF6912 family protein [Glycomyces paridis]|uniref:Uncharacterized protein n=1 Tax=Glycomyces paridis TaxID=2126555 RepID=A0A4S8PME5_9ACTN|nr:hypothetical protein [Glycomyces paridis]THV32028.1 hypothetical protein E9998_00810 [Glycomyces paridis]